MGPKPSPKPPLDVDAIGDPINSRRYQYPTNVTDWSKHKQLGPSCDMDENGDPVPPKVVKG